MTCYLTTQTLPKPILSFHKRGFVAFTPAISKVVFNKTYLTKVCVKITILKSWLHFPCTSQFTVFALKALQWRYNGRDGVSNHQPQDCFLNRLFRHRAKKTSKLCVTGLCAGNSPDAGEFPAQMASNAENVSIWWRHHGFCHDKLYKQRFLTPGHQGWNDLHRLCRIGMEYYFSNNNNNSNNNINNNNNNNNDNDYNNNNNNNNNNKRWWW